MARRLTAAQAKAAKQKKLVILLGVIFLVVGGVQGPKFWKQLHPKPAGEAAPTPGSVPAAAGTPTAAASAAAPGQLQTFRHLKLKDPFKALVTVPVGDNGSSAPAASTPEEKPSTPEEKPAAPKQPEPEPKQPKTPAEPAASGTVSFSAAKPPPNAAIVTTNGRKQLVYIGDGFPTADPVFRLVALAKKAVRVGVLGGSFTSGLPTIKLARGEPVTLANEADGTRYVIKLVRLTTAAPKPEPTSTTRAAPASTPTATTPATTTPATTTPTTTTAAASS
jgi:hypothetical protein